MWRTPKTLELWPRNKLVYQYSKSLRPIKGLMHGLHDTDTHPDFVSAFIFFFWDNGQRQDEEIRRIKVWWTHVVQAARNEKIYHQ